MSLGANTASADAKHGAAFNWVRLSGAEQCITAGELAEGVERRLERKVFVLDARAQLSVDGYVMPRPDGGWSAHVALVDSARNVLGERAIETREPDCRKLDPALVLVLALTLLPNAHKGAGMSLAPGTEQLLRELFEGEPSVPDVQLGDGAPAHAAPAAPAASPAPRSNPRDAVEQRSLQPSAAESIGDVFMLGAAPLLSLGYLPGLNLGVEVSLALALPMVWPLRLAAMLLPVHEHQVAGTTTASTSFGLRQLSLTTCPWQTGEVLRLGICAGLSAGQLLTRSRGYAVGGGARSDLMFDATALAAAHWHVLPNFALQLVVMAALPFIQRSYEYQALDAQTTRLFRTAQVCAHIALGVAATL